MTVAGCSSQNSSHPSPKVTSPNSRMNKAANATGTMMMMHVDYKGTSAAQ